MSKNDKKTSTPKNQRAKDYIHALGHTIFMTNLLKGLVLVLAIAVVAESLFMLRLLGKVAEVRPLPIFVDREAGTARPVDFSAIDAEGQKRVDAEIHDFIRDYVANLYTFTRLTVESNLRRVLDLTSSEARNMVKNAIYQSRRNEALQGGYQGVCDIRSISILEANMSDIRCQVTFDRKWVGADGEDRDKRSIVAVIRLKTVIRQKGNAHGLYTVEYRESEIQEATR